MYIYISHVVPMCIHLLVREFQCIYMYWSSSSNVYIYIGKGVPMCIHVLVREFQWICIHWSGSSNDVRSDGGVHGYFFFHGLYGGVEIHHASCVWYDIRYDMLQYITPMIWCNTSLNPMVSHHTLLGLNPMISYFAKPYDITSYYIRPIDNDITSYVSKPYDRIVRH